MTTWSDHPGSTPPSGQEDAAGHELWRDPNQAIDRVDQPDHPTQQLPIVASPPRYNPPPPFHTASPVGHTVLPIGHTVSLSGPPRGPIGLYGEAPTGGYAWPAMPSSPPLGASRQPPPPPLYPPLRQFPGSGPGGPGGSTSSSSPNTGRVRRIVLAVTVIVVVAALGFGLGSQFTGGEPASRSDAANGESQSGRSLTTAAATGGIASPTSDQDGPVTEAPQLDPDLADEPAAAVNNAVSPSVVQIETTGGLGTGFIYDGQGYILTAAHVVAGTDASGNVATDFEREVTVRLADGTRVKGQVLGADLNNDVAVVKIDPRPTLPVAALALGRQPEVGSIAIAIGSPFGLDQTVTQGIVSAINRPVPSPNNNLVSMIQTDAAINSGNSGGPLVNRDGQVIGINTQIRTDTGDNAGIGFAVPIDLAYDVAQSLIEGKPIRLGFLGVRGDDPAFGSSGAMVVRVEPGSPAEKAGLQEGDVITAANGRIIRGFEELASIIRATQPGERLQLKVERDEATLDVQVTVGEATTR